MFKQTLLLVAIVSTVLPLTACDKEVEIVEVVDDPTESITELTATINELSIFDAALKASDLDKELMENNSNFTVFAPNNDAFMTLLDRLDMSQDALLADKQLLTEVLTYHVIPNSAWLTEDIPFEQPIKTVNGQTITIKEVNAIIDAHGDSAAILESDVVATNGVVHVINEVLMPMSL